LRIIALADLHYDIARCREDVRAQAEEVLRRGADALLIAGDTASADSDALVEALRLFEPFPGRRLLIAGNHDLWVRPGGDSRRRYEQELPEICRRCGFEYLDAAPVMLDGIAIVGTIGWYDYSFRDETLAVPRRFYEAKVGPGAAALLGRYQHLVDGFDDVTDEMLQITAVWRDGQHVELGMPDDRFTAEQANKLREHLRWAVQRAERIVAVLHHVPLLEMVPHRAEPNWRFARAFLGSTRLEEVLAAEPKVRHVLAGHSHWPCRVQRDGVEYINIGSGYRKKRSVTLEL